MSSYKLFDVFDNILFAEEKVSAIYLPLLYL